MTTNRLVDCLMFRTRRLAEVAAARPYSAISRERPAGAKRTRRTSTRPNARTERGCTGRVGRARTPSPSSSTSGGASRSGPSPRGNRTDGEREWAGSDDDFADGLAVDEKAQRVVGSFQGVVAGDVRAEFAGLDEADELVTDRSAQFRPRAVIAP